MESRNLILAIILSVGVLFIWSFFFETPEQEILNGEIESGDVSEVNSNELDMEAIEEIERSLGIKRITKCHPIKLLGGSEGYDPVPKEKK